MKYCTISAPFDGVISKIITHQHEYVDKGSPIFKIISYTPIKLVAHFNESLINKIHVGDILEIRFKFSDTIYPFKIINTVREIEPETKTFKVYAENKNSDNELVAGMVGICLSLKK